MSCCETKKTRRKSQLGLFVGLSIIIVVTLTICSENRDNMTVKEKIEYFSNNDTDYFASATDSVLSVTDEDGNKVQYDMPEDEFYVSIAPYINSTHPCAIHSPSGCSGELKSKEFDVKITKENGTVVVDKKMKSQKNGFIDFWLDRDETYTVEISYDGKSALQEITTYSGDYTCVTTMKLK